MNYAYTPEQASSYYNSGTGRYHTYDPTKNLAPEWDGDPDSVPPGYGVIRVELGQDSHEHEPVGVSVNGFNTLIPRGSARIVSSIHINRLRDCIITEYTQAQFYRPPEGFQRPRFPITIIVQPKELGELIDTNTGHAIKPEAKTVKAPRKRQHSLEVGVDESNSDPNN